jgi:hypothetical protein
VFVQSRSELLVTTLEYMELPANVGAIVSLRSTLGRLGLVTGASLVDPGYRGRLVLPLHNLGHIPICLYPGVRLFAVAFAEIQGVGAAGYPRVYEAAAEADPSQLVAPGELEDLKSLLSDRANNLQADYAPRKPIQVLLSEALEAEGKEKGMALERLVTEICKTIEGLKVLRVDARLKAEELDIVLQNDNSDGFWRFLGSPIVVECKNWSHKVGAREISVLFDKLDSISPDAKTGILVAPNGVSGDTYSDAVLKIREKRKAGRYIIVLDRNDLDEIAKGTHAAKVIEHKYTELLVIESVRRRRGSL